MHDSRFSLFDIQRHTQIIVDQTIVTHETGPTTERVTGIPSLSLIDLTHQQPIKVTATLDNNSLISLIMALISLAHDRDTPLDQIQEMLLCPETIRSEAHEVTITPMTNDGFLLDLIQRKPYAARIRMPGTASMKADLLHALTDPEPQSHGPKKA